jgi:hypothetical protein
MWSVARLYKESTVLAGSNTPTVTRRVVGGDEKGSFKSETVKYGHESQGTRTRETLRWRRPAAYAKDRPVLSSGEGAPQKQDRSCQRLINIWSWKYLVMSPRWGSKPRLTDWLTVSHNVILTFPIGGFKYLHRSPASRRRRRKGNPVPGGITGPLCSWERYILGHGPPGWGSLESETVKYGHESPGTRTREWLR